MEYGDYRLRYAAGMYWLLNIRQNGLDYVKPLCLNECGAQIWQMLRDGLDNNAIADRLCEKYGLEHEEALKDIEDFAEQIEKRCSVG